MTTPDHPIVPGLRLQRLLGEGACGRVFEAVDDLGRPWAAKLLEPEAINFSYVDYCFTKMLDLPAHPCLVPVGAYYADESQGSALYTMPLYVEPAPGGVGLISRSLELKPLKATL